MDSERARGLIRHAFPELPALSVRPFGEGWANTAFLVDDALLFRFPKNERVAAAVGREMALLPALGAKAGLPVPVPDYRFAAREGALDFPWPFGGYPLIPGTPLSSGPEVAPAFAGAVGDFLTALHRFPVEQAAACGVPGGKPEAWRAEYRRWYAETRALIWPHLSLAEQQSVAAFIERFLDDDRHFRFKPVLLHHDLSPDHLLVEDAVLTGVIDFEDAIIGDPCFDLIGVLHLGPGVLDHYRGPIDPGFFDRMRFYTRLWPLHEIRYGVESGQSEHIQRGLARLQGGV